jgi:hypothetical protein
MINPRLRTLLFMAGILTLGPQCKRRDHGAISDGGANGEYAIVHNKDGSSTRVRLGAGPIPPEFPPGLKLYPGAEFSSTARTAKDVIVNLRTPDSLDAVFAFYRKQPGFDEISDVEVNGMRVLHLKHRASGKDFQVVVKVGPRTEVSLIAPLG